MTFSFIVVVYLLILIYKSLIFLLLFSFVCFVLKCCTIVYNVCLHCVKKKKIIIVSIKLRKPSIFLLFDLLKPTWLQKLTEVSVVLRLRRSSSSGCWDHRDVWDSISGTTEPDCACEPRDPFIGCDGGPEDKCYPLRRRSSPTRPPLFTDQPDLTPLIDTNFTSQPPCRPPTPPRGGFDFGGLVERAYMEHEPPSPSTYPSPSSASSSPPTGVQVQRSPCLGESAGLSNPEKDSGAGAPSPAASADWESSVWAMELRGNLIAAGRSSGKLEVCLISVRESLKMFKTSLLW